MTHFKLGRKPAVHNLATMRAALTLAPHLAALGPAPWISDDWVSAVDKATGGDWGVDLNDSLGCCVIADSAHQVMLHTANAGSIVVPTDAQVLAMYEAVGGYKPGDSATDQGCNESDACQYLMTTGLAGQKSAGTAMVDPANLDHLRWCVQLFGACRLGINITQAMMDDFSSGYHWSAMVGPVIGGHDVPIVKYDSDAAYVVTWGKLQAIAWDLMADAQFLDESHAEVYPDFMRASGTAPNGFNLAQLLADLPQLQAA